MTRCCPLIVVVIGPVYSGTVCVGTAARTPTFLLLPVGLFPRFFRFGLTGLTGVGDLMVAVAFAGTMEFELLVVLVPSSSSGVLTCGNNNVVALKVVSVSVVVIVVVVDVVVEIVEAAVAVVVVDLFVVLVRFFLLTLFNDFNDDDGRL